MEIPENKDKLFYTIGEVAEIFSVNVSHIRFWENEFDILKPKKNGKGNRLFTPQDLKNLQMIYHLVKEKGMTLAGAKKLLKENKTATIQKFEIISRLKNIKKELLEIKEQLSMPEDSANNATN